MPNESDVSNLDAQLQTFHPDWLSAPVFRENPEFRTNLLSSLAWGLGGEALTFAEISLTTKTTGVVRIVGFTNMTILEIEGHHDSVLAPTVRIVGRSQIRSVEIVDPSALVTDLMYPPASVMTVTISHETLGDVTVGANDASRELVADFLPTLLADL